MFIYCKTAVWLDYHSNVWIVNLEEVTWFYKMVRRKLCINSFIEFPYIDHHSSRIGTANISYLSFSPARRRLHFRSVSLVTTIDFPIHLSDKTGSFEALYQIPKSYTTTNNHFVGTLLIIFHYRKNMNMCSSPKFWELGSFLSLPDPIL